MYIKLVLYTLWRQEKSSSFLAAILTGHSSILMSTNIKIRITNISIWSIDPHSFILKAVWLSCADYQQWSLEKFWPNLYVARDKCLKGKQ